MNIYVANLSWNTNSDSLQELFSQYGEVTSAYIINDRETGRSPALSVRGHWLFSWRGSSISGRRQTERWLRLSVRLCFLR